MLEKYRVHEVAKDLGVPTKEVADLLTAKLGSEYKSMTALNEQQLSMIFNHYTKQNQVENFEAYFAEGTAARDGARQTAKNPAPQQRQQPRQQKPAQQSRPQQKGQNNPERNNQERNTQNGQERNNQNGQQRQPRQNNGGRQQEERRGQGNRNNQNNNNGQNNRDQNNSGRPQRQGQGQNKGDRQQRNNNGQQRQGQQDRQQRPGNNQQRPQAAQAPQQNNSGKAPAANKPKQRGSATVDMRAGSTQVEMERYNEKYDNLAQSKMGNRDVGVQKQKLTQRSAQRRGKPVMSRKEKEDAKMRRLEMERQRRQKLEITIPDQITVGDLAARLHVTASEIIKRLMALGVMASVNEVIDYDTAAMVSIEIGAKVEREVVVTIEERLFEVEEDDDGNLTERPPIVVVMGHVDHGKTSLLDAIRHANVTEGEAGGITQHIGAYQVEVNERPITFLDTPGHAAFTSMRARGAQVTDIAVLVVAADDGIMPQTVEAINHAKAAEVSIIVAINKIDKPHANPDKVMQELTEHGIVPEDWGGDVPCIRVSAKTKEGIGDLLEMIQLVADTSELKANPDRRAKGTVIEAKLDRGRGPVATILVQTGTLREGDAVIAGTTFGRVRTMRNDKGERVQEAGPSMPVEITGLDDVPEAGDTLNAVADERLAKELVEQRKQQLREEQFSTYEKVTLDNLFSHISQGDIKELPIIVKADVQGSVEAVKQSLEKLSNDEVRVKVIHGAVGAVNESDVMLADASNAVIVGFNVRPDPAAKENAERDGVELRLYRIIYDAINDVETAMKGMLAPKTREVDLGRAEVRQVYRITGVGMVAGCYVLDGKITRSAEIRVVRDGIIIADDKLASLKRFKDDVKEVAKGYECGMTLTKFSDIKEGDVFEAYEIEEYRE
ncbi:MAG: translation initiation factor IF-2 [Oscillospiraceae bacterium]|nr:translation initiation factor IF-2 [Oscillospiraceae bacterium]RKJ57144.1 translation initiation factor IF-2 [bacterium 1XD42-8]RKJ66271.1 translation initiation factor IF-2 [bacterium 1XD42-1]